MRLRHLVTGVSVVLLLCGAFAFAQAQQQDKSKRPSPPGTAEVTLKGKKITIDYSRPFLKGRHVGQELAPFGKVWRTGANEATTLTTEVNLNIGGTKVPAGTYTLYTVPSEGTWKLIINKQTGQWGTVYDESQDLARIDMQKAALPQSVEQFTISFDKMSEDTADLNLDWEKTRVSVVVKAE
jgi:ABC-type phosphate transport system substrate-binding protein